MINKLKSSASLAAIIVASGFAASALSTTAEAGQSTQWQGFYIGAHLGAGEANYDGIFNSTDDAVNFEHLELSGILAGGQIGYNLQRGMWVFGVEGDVSFMDWSDYIQADSSSEAGSAELDLLASIRGRVGITVDEERTGLLYVTGGIAFSDGEVQVFNSGEFDSDMKNQAFDLGSVGYAVGGGFEWAVSDPVRLRFETLYYGFGDSEDIDITMVTDANTGDFVEFESAWTFRVGVSWYFN